LIPSIPADAGKLPDSDDDRRQGPRLSAHQFVELYIYIIGGVVTIYALLAGGVDTGWTFYVPYSTTFSNSYVIATGLGISLTDFLPSSPA